MILEAGLALIDLIERHTDEGVWEQMYIGRAQPTADGSQ